MMCASRQHFCAASSRACAWIACVGEQTSMLAQQASAEVSAVFDRVPDALVVRWFARIDTEQQKYGAISLTEKTGAGGDVTLVLHRPGELDTGPLCHLLQVSAETSVALLVTGLPIVAIVDAHNRQIGRVH